MRLAAFDLAVDAPAGWEARIERRPATVDGEIVKPVVHAATFPLPAERGDYGSGAVEIMAAGDVFIALLEWEGAQADTALFRRNGMPRTLDPEAFATNQLQRWIPNQAGLQVFFTDGGRPFCLYVVLGDYDNRVALVKTANQLLATIQIESIYPPGVL